MISPAQDQLLDLIRSAGEGVASEFVSAVEALRPKTQIERAIVAAILTAAERHGLAAVRAGVDELRALLDGKMPSTAEMLMLSPVSRSDFLAALQLEEMGRDSVRRYIDTAGTVLGRVLGVVGRIALASVV